MILHLIRHGETVANDLLLGRTDAESTEQGYAEVVEQLRGLPFDELVSSPLQRARRAAEVAAAATSRHLRIDPDWSEMDFGRWDGQPIADLRQSTDGAYDRFLTAPQSLTPPDGEAWTAFRARITRALKRLTAANAATRIAVVAHAGPMRCALHIACGLPLEQTWTLKIAHGACLTLQVGAHEQALWGEIIELRQA